MDRFHNIMVALFFFMSYCEYCDDWTEKRNSVHPMGEYDERQRADQLFAFRSAFLTVCCYLGVWGLLEAFDMVLWEPGFGAWLGVALGLGTHNVICILRDAHLRPKDKRDLGVSFSTLYVLWLVTDIDKWVSNGRLSGKASLLTCILLALAQDVALIVHRATEKRKAKEDAEP